MTHSDHDLERKLEQLHPMPMSPELERRLLDIQESLNPGPIPLDAPDPPLRSGGRWPLVGILAVAVVILVALALPTALRTPPSTVVDQNAPTPQGPHELMVLTNQPTLVNFQTALRQEHDLFDLLDHQSNTLLPEYPTFDQVQRAE